MIESIELEKILPGKSVIICSSARQSRFVQNESDRRNSDLGEFCWENSVVLPWNQWLQKIYAAYILYQVLSPKKIVNDQSIQKLKLLDEFQEKLLLDKIIEDELENQFQWNALQRENLTNQIVSAWKVFNQWNFKFGVKESFDSEFFSTQETKIFYQVILRYQNFCEKSQYLSPCQLASFLIQNLDQNSFKCLPELLANKVYFYGFDEWTPQQQSFLSKLSQIGCEIQPCHLSIEKNTQFEAKCTLYQCASQAVEWRHAAQWARELAETNPGAKIAVVIPNLANVLTEVSNSFQNCFMPKSQLQAEEAVACGFNVSMGTPLIYQPVVCSSLRWLLALQGLDIDNWVELITDLYSEGGTQEIWQRQSLAFSLRNLVASKKHGKTPIAIKQVLDQIAKLNIDLPLLLVKKLRAIQQIVHSSQANNFRVKTKQEKNNDYCFTLNKKASASEWIEWVSTFLFTNSLLDLQKLSSIDYQAYQQWNTQLTQMVILDSLFPLMTFSQFIHFFQQRLKLTIFQAESAPANVQVLGLFEAIGLPFDYMLVTGMDENSMPAPISPTPWLPISLQKKYSMPGSSSQKELEFSQKLLLGFEQLSKQIHYSYVMADGETRRECSPLCHSSDQTINLEIKSDSYWQINQSHGQSLLETQWVDQQGIPLQKQTGDEFFRVKNGVSLLKDQALCPFKAYATHRLQAKSTDEISLGIDPRERGNFIHKVLETFWHRVGDQAHLLQLDESELVDLISEITQQVIHGANQKDVLLNYEYARTISLVLKTLEHDKNRPPFKQVDVEQQQDLTISQLKFTVRLDRVDQLSDGKLLLIDYKTGSASVNGWEGERVEEPQLPLYAQLLEQEVAAIAFVIIKMDECRYLGYGESDVEITGVKLDKKKQKSWQEYLQDWKRNLEMVAQEYALGVATVTPTKNACTYCELPHLCRIKLLGGIDNGDQEMVR